MRLKLFLMIIKLEWPRYFIREKQVSFPAFPILEATVS